MPVARPEPQEARVIAHVDLDCFYVQVEQRKRPELRGRPTAVVQYNSWKGGGLIAVGYEARAFGVKRSMRGDEAKKACPDIQLVQVPVARGKADLTLYREAGSEVVSVLARKGRCERASIDEVYLDITDAATALLSEQPPESVELFSDEVLKTHIVGLSKDGEDRREMMKSWLCSNNTDHKNRMLVCGAIIVAELRMQVLSETQFTCSAGIAHNKMLAKLASGMHKPAQQTVVPGACVPDLLASLPVKKMKQLGGKLGSSLESDLGVQTVGDLLQFSEQKLQERYGMNTGTWLWNIARGISGDEVKGRLLPKSQGCGKTFPGPQALRTIASVEHWLGELSAELNDRIQVDLEQNKRIAHQLILHARAHQEYGMNSNRKFPSKSCPLRYGKEKILQDALQLFEHGLREYCGGYGGGKRDSQHGHAWAIVGLSVTASNFFATPSGVNPITRFFPGSTSISDSSADLHLSAKDLNHDETTQDKKSLREEYVEEIAEDSTTGLQPDICQMGIDTNDIFQMGIDTNEDCISSCSFTEAEDTRSVAGGSKNNIEPGEILNQVKEKLVPFQYFQITSDENCDGHANSSYQPTKDPLTCFKTVSRKKEAASLYHAGNKAERLSSETFIQDHEQKQGIKKMRHLETKPDKKVVSLKLEDIWKKSGDASSTVSSTQQIDNQKWYYKPEEIDESILTELPEEIQLELRSSLRIKHQHTIKCPTIGDYFKHKSNS
ncbi:DNA polymerase eta isoform X2 [Cryptomeria japonica]|uniref:DNA polymerase eta isoform X2 n=1 Tax=Cryptomeria japonica TaxID=3369 RepID=UPI0027DA9F20|nr:DNA polymerase eta isoform X2 [Cryptomeria japonica]